MSEQCRVSQDELNHDGGGDCTKVPLSYVDFISDKEWEDNLFELISQHDDFKKKFIHYIRWRSDIRESKIFGDWIFDVAYAGAEKIMVGPEQ